MDILGVLTFLISLIFFIMWLYVTYREYKLLESINEIISGATKLKSL
ncbi:hypothetical protein QKT26_gp23 [Carcinus maenas nudivirus]|uniref:Uncharacterized protein n=1 Tax=Carcinus maenas nudivirus TaxID=2880837 RepID=A0AAE8Y3F1_9VIRU|nr:hypothetical protein QKT26_gp23 [Carcinus maenas nudivirus]UBZ25613.1 hypothetical protein CmNV_023 [Carcinus maenas nudivirus]